MPAVQVLQTMEVYEILSHQNICLLNNYLLQIKMSLSYENNISKY